MFGYSILNDIKIKHVYEADDNLYNLLKRNLYKLRLNDDILMDLLGENGVLRPGDLIGIAGKSNCGKSLLLGYIMAQCILPKELGGHNLSVLYIDTDNSFCIEVFLETHLLPTIEKYYENYYQINEDLIINNKDMLISSLDNFKVVSVSDILDFISILRTIMTDNTNPNIIIIDSLTFWKIQNSSSIFEYIVSQDNNDNNNKDNNIKYNELYTNKLNSYLFGLNASLNTLYNCSMHLLSSIIDTMGVVVFVTIDEEYITNKKYRNILSKTSIEILSNPDLNDYNMESYYNIELPLSNRSNNESSHLQDSRLNKVTVRFPKLPSGIFETIRIQYKVNNLNFKRLLWITCTDTREITSAQTNIPTYFNCINDNKKMNYMIVTDSHGVNLLN
ncbi:uncharacterized protein CMU_003080 [Cryptosporidium muris RN66]|uniref:Uncharacterized protein n=1 Tax=Cryptosporidium muris (strain RN66) TaxID=441375 RepID=B6AJT7_CRYMR|nr:uncharacterized protein CMU_003080 [Cryptosporidium muris RN66]EEA08478.1 hypothetical protein, conserved [Cryptosporidium muris RN66]|eukprot:XP_002142827.1 hypothetical protein [Cryptosporidium muris RN66]